MVHTCTFIRDICGADLHIGKDRHQRCQFQFGYRHSHIRCIDYVLGYGIYHQHPGRIGEISRRSWLFLILSGLATGASWLCYYKALQLGEASKVVPIDKLSVVITMVLAAVFLHEKFTPKSILGCALIGIGTLLMLL